MIVSAEDPQKLVSVDPTYPPVPPRSKRFSHVRTSASSGSWYLLFTGIGMLGEAIGAFMHVLSLKFRELEATNVE